MDFAFFEVGIESVRIFCVPDFTSADTGILRSSNFYMCVLDFFLEAVNVGIDSVDFQCLKRVIMPFFERVNLFGMLCLERIESFIDFINKRPDFGCACLGSYVD